MNRLLAATALGLVLGAGVAAAAEHPIGRAIERDGMRIAAVYLQGVMMEGMEHDAHDPGAVHLEADIHALKGNKNGFAAGEWIPNLGVTYLVTKPGDPSVELKGELIPMVANDGPHYGQNVILPGPGKYHVAFHVTPPNEHGFTRHIDKETGVGPWWSGFDQEWDFTFVGSVGKKGGY